LRKRFDDHTLTIAVSLEDEMDSKRATGCGLFGIG